MGLGKTVQAIAACEFLGPEERYTTRAGGLPHLGQGRMGGPDRPFHRPRACVSSPGAARRLRPYSEPAFFTLVNYEQVVRDADDINRLFKPDDRDASMRRSASRTGTPRRPSRSSRSDRPSPSCSPARRSRTASTSFTHRPISRPGDFRAAVPLQPRLLRARRPRPARRLSKHRTAAPRLRRLCCAGARRCGKRTPGRTVQNYFVPHGEEQAARYDDYHIVAATWPPWRSGAR